MFKRILIVCFLLCTCAAFGQAKKRVAVARPDCSEAEFNAMNSLMDALTVKFSATKQIPVFVMIENMGQADAFHLASAEVLNGLFPGKFDVVQDQNRSQLIFHVSGTKTTRETEMQHVGIELVTYRGVQVSVNGKKKSVVGTLVFTSESGTVSGDLPYKVQFFKQLAYKAVNDFLQQVGD